MTTRPLCLVFSIAYLVCIMAVAQQPRTPDANTEGNYPTLRFHKQLSKSQKAHILDGPFRTIATTEAMPATVKQAFTEIAGEHSFALANPGEKYQVTDVVSEAELPFRRLVFAGANGDEWFIHYERGGRGHSYSVIVFKIYAPYRLRFLWGGAGFRAAANLQELQKMVAAGHFADDAAYSW